jgi:ABC-type multidrug transport system ATPase subunit
MLECVQIFVWVQAFVEEVLELVELKPLENALVGLPGITGLSTEQRKRLTIAVELVANPSIIFMDEPTSGLDARAAAIVMRTVRNTVDTGRTVVCTIHQPSIDIFEAFDEVRITYFSQTLIARWFFEI